jgi:hypothetical protein
MRTPPLRQKTFGGVISHQALKGELHRLLGTDCSKQGKRQRALTQKFLTEAKVPF